jgi:hypothetical protein
LADWNNLLEGHTKPYIGFSKDSKRVEFASPAVGSFVDVNVHFIKDDLKDCLGLKPCNKDDAKSLRELSEKTFMKIGGDMPLPFMSVPASAGTMISNIADLPTASIIPDGVVARPIPPQIFVDCDPLVTIADTGPKNDEKQKDVDGLVLRCLFPWSDYLAGMTGSDASTLRKMNAHFIRAAWLVMWLDESKKYLLSKEPVGYKDTLYALNVISTFQRQKTLQDESEKKVDTVLLPIQPQLSADEVVVKA